MGNGCCKPTYLTSSSNSNNIKNKLHDTVDNINNGLHEIKDNINDKVIQPIGDGLHDIKVAIVEEVKEIKRKIWGVKLSKPDYNDIRASKYLDENKSLKAQSSKDIDYRDELTDIRNQGSAGSCVSMAGISVTEWYFNRKKKRKEYVELSVSFVYNLRKPDPRDSEGMEARDLINILSKYGTPLESTYPYSKIDKDIPKSVYKEALKYRPPVDKIRIDTYKAMCKCLTYGPCIMILPVMDEESRYFWKKTNKKDKSTGAHCVAVVGVKDGELIIRNSWGEKWADHGYSYMKKDDWDMDEDIYKSVREDSVPLEAWCILKK